MTMWGAPWWVEFISLGEICDLAGWHISKLAHHCCPVKVYKL